MLHRTGNRRKHITKNLKVPRPTNGGSNGTLDATEAHLKTAAGKENNGETANMFLNLDGTVINGSGATFGEWMTKRAKSVPLRLDAQERSLMRLLEAALNVSEYTGEYAWGQTVIHSDKIDIISYSNKGRRIVTQIKDLCAIISGLLASGDYKVGAQLFAGQSVKENEEFFQRVFEVGRRAHSFKIMNPEKMRTIYGKLMYMLMDSVIPEVKESLGFSCVIPIKTVYNFLKERELVELLHDDSVVLATREIPTEFKTRAQINAEVQRKKNTIETLCQKYANERISAEEIERCLASLSDNNAYLKANRWVILLWATADFCLEILVIRC
ncbi:hypothetical protein DFQ30_011279 [Apophysomyces sp. BC1015]|nr:hypothetical protein DFQ30_011279 [Apophysomyces sp. BC1015]